MAKLELKDGRASVSSGGAKQSVYENVNLEASNVSFKSQVPVQLSANLPGGGTFNLDGKAGPVNAADSSLTPLDAKVTIKGLDLAKKDKFLLFCVALLLLAASSALGQDIRYNFDNKADFSKFRTYKWITLKSEAPIDELTDGQIKAALDAAFARKGLRKVDSESADLFIGYQTTEHIDEKFARFSPGWSTGPGWAAGGWYGAASGTDSGLIYQGELAVDMYDPANQHLIWRGVASKTLDPKAQAEKRQKNLNKAVAKLMKNYPPRAQK